MTVLDRHIVSSGVVVVENSSVLLVAERGRWGLPKGGVEPDEPLITTAIREAREETGLVVEVRGLAFVTEFRRSEWNEHHVQMYFAAQVAGGSLLPRDPDGIVREARFVPVDALRHYLKFRPRLLPLEQWLADGVARHHYFDLDIEPVEV